MKIALVIGRYNGVGGGAERWTDRHAKHLLSKGHEVHLVSRSFLKPADGAKLYIVEKARGRLRFAENATKKLQQIGVDAVHDMGDGWTGDVFSPHHGTRIGGFIAGDAMAPRWWRGVRRFSRTWLPRYREFAALEKRQFAPGSFRAIVALSKRVQRDMIQHFRLDAGRVEVVYNGVDAEKFRPADTPQLEARRANIRRAWGWEDRVVFLLVAHNFRLKGLDALLHALRQLRRTHSKVGLVVAGEDRTTGYRLMADKLGIGSAVRFLGDQSDAAALYQAADVYVQPTFYDPCSLVVLEAMASGLPTITTTANGAGELLVHGRSGFVLDDPRDVDGLAEFTGAALEEKFRRQAGRAARRTAELHSMAANSERYVELYQGRNQRAAA